MDFQSVMLIVYLDMDLMVGISIKCVFGIVICCETVRLSVDADDCYQADEGRPQEWHMGDADGQADVALEVIAL